MSPVGVSTYDVCMTQDQRSLRLGAVSYLNTIPLISGLERIPGVEIVADVPARLGDRLVAGETDLSLCSIIDYQRSPVPLELVPVGQIGCDGDTRTVAIFSREPLDSVTEIACDVESHTSVALAQIILAERYGHTVAVTPFPTDQKDLPSTIMVIGDKVARFARELDTHGHRLDLGRAWHDLTGLPFVFASWFRVADPTPEERTRLDRLADLVDHARRRNHDLVPTLARREAAKHGWAVDEAVHYLGTLLRYDFDDASVEAIERFFDLAATHGVIEERRPLRIATPAPVAAIA